MLRGPSSPRAWRLLVLVALVVATPAVVAAAPTFLFERIGAFDVLASPGENVVLPARITNHGTGPDTFPLSGQPTNTNGAWQVFPSSARRVDPGANATVDAWVPLPQGGGASLITMRACSATQAASCRDLTWRVSTPLTARLTMDERQDAREAVTGVVNVTWPNGAPARGAAVRIQHQTTPVTVSFVEEFETDARGLATFVLESPVSRLPGEHLVFVEASSGDAPVGRASGSYMVGLI